MFKKVSVFLIVLLMLAGCSAPTADVDREDKSAGLQVVDGGTRETLKAVNPGDLKQAVIVSIWRTTAPGETITLPLESSGYYDCEVYWGDSGPGYKITSYDDPDKTHVYASAGDHHVYITGKFYGWSFNNSGDKLKLIEMNSMFNMRWGNSGGYFYGCANLQKISGPKPDLTGTTYMYSAFRDCSSLAMVEFIQYWDVSKVTNMNQMFRSASKFNGSIQGWDVSSVTDMSSMFSSASSFNQPIGNWNVANVKDMAYMLADAKSFNQFIGNWNVSGVKNMTSMFQFAIVFNQPIINWNVANVTDMYSMFSSAKSFNQPIGNWNVANVKSMAFMFKSAYSFNQPIGNWNVANATDMSYMFNNAKTFNQPINNWDVNNVLSWDGIFDNCPIINNYKPNKFK